MDEMQYVVTYEYLGDADLSYFDDPASALKFIKENVNSGSFGEFRMFTEITLDFSVIIQPS